MARPTFLLAYRPRKGCARERCATAPLRGSISRPASEPGDRSTMLRLLLKIQYVLNAPFSILAITTSASIQPAYRMGLLRRVALGLRMLFNITRVRTGTSYKAHLAMAVKLFEMPPETAGCVIECGTWKGGSAVNLSLVCRIVGRK